MYSKTPYNAFLSIIKEKDDRTLSSTEVICPFCDSKDITISSNITTLVAFDNHITKTAFCNQCKQKFQQHIKEDRKDIDHVWYVNMEGKILKGIPHCFERFVYTCSSCGGNIIRKYLDENGEEPIFGLSSGPDKNGVWINHYKIIFFCDKCGISIESGNDNFDPRAKNTTYEEEVEKAKNRYSIKPGWTVVEEQDIGVIYAKPE